MALFKLISSYAAAKAKELVTDIFDTLDLDKNGELDKNQLHRWCDTVGGAFGRLDDAIDQEKVVEIVKDVAGTVKEIAAYIEGVKEHSEVVDKPKK